MSIKYPFLSLIAFTLAALIPIATAQPTDVRAPDIFSWGENIGYINFAGIPSGPGAVYLLPNRVSPSYMAGYAWAENIGWINFGNGSPSDGYQYQNLDSTDFGVNLDPTTGDLYGYAWAENAGWINFDTRATLAGSKQQANLNFSSMRLYGFAWGENIGWINLNDEETFIRFWCTVDFNYDNSIDFFDVTLFLQNLYDLDSNGNFDFFDVSRFLLEFSLGCPE